jgi:hypothetical protein
MFAFERTLYSAGQFFISVSESADFFEAIVKHAYSHEVRGNRRKLAFKDPQEVFDGLLLNFFKMMTDLKGKNHKW